MLLLNFDLEEITIGRMILLIIVVPVIFHHEIPSILCLRCGWGSGCWVNRSLRICVHGPRFYQCLLPDIVLATVFVLVGV